MDEDVTRVLRTSWVAAAGLSVLGAGVAAALTVSTPGPVPEGRLVAADVATPRPIALSFPAPAPAPAPVAAAPAAPAPTRPAAVRTSAPRAADPACVGAGWQQRRGERALSRLRRPADARSVQVAFRPARRDVLGLAHLDQRRVEVFVRSCARQSEALLVHVLAHELGHVLDATRLTDELRAEWMRRRGIPAGTPWFGCDGCRDFATPAGDFAETYAQWQRGARSSRSELAPPPSPAELERLAARFF